MEKVAKRFREIYDIDLWLDAHDELHKYSPSDKETATLLMEILEVRVVLGPTDKLFLADFLIG